MSKKPIILSSAGLKNIVKDDDDFIFVFDSQELSMNNLFAEFISPVISRLHLSDPTIRKIEYKDPLISSFFNSQQSTIKTIFNEIKQHFEGNPIHISESEANPMRIFSILLGNSELYHIINDSFPRTQDSNNIDHYLKEAEIFHSISHLTKFEGSDFNDIIEFISVNFESFEREKLRGLPKPLIHSIISNEKLKIENEDSLVDFIRSIFVENSSNINNDDDEFDFISFLELVQMGNLTDEKFCEVISGLNARDVSEGLWQRICSRFCGNEKDKKKSKCERYVGPKGIEIKYDGNEEHGEQGIIRRLTNECGGNVHDKGVVEVTTSSDRQNDSSRKAKFAVEFDNRNGWFCTAKDNENNMWLQYDFKEKKVRPTHYAIRSKPYNSGDRHPRFWVIEGSNDGNEWKTLDSRNDINDLNGKNIIHVYEIQEKLEKNEFYKCLRIRQTGKNAANNYYFGFSSLEYFGSII